VPTNEINPANAGNIKLALHTITPLVDYHCQITNVALEPTQNNTTRPGTYCGAPVDTPGASSWALVISFLQDWGFTPSLSEFTFTNDGALIDFDFTSNNPLTCPNMTGTAYVTATAFGGAPGESWQVTTQRWACTAKPTLVPSLTTLSVEEQTTDELSNA
jgi:hypothetical protein